MVGWHHRLDGYGFGWTPGVGDGQGGLEWCSSWGLKESDMTDEDVEKREPSYSVGRIVNWYSCCREHYEACSRKLKIELLCD